MRILVIGGTSFLGRHFVAQALGRGHELTLFNRGVTAPDLFPEAERIRGDRERDLSPLAGRTWDVAVDTCGYLPRVVGASAGRLADAVARYVFVSTTSVFPDDAPPGITEDDPTLEPPPPAVEEITDETYGPLKTGCEREVERALPGRALVIRPGYIVGPHDPSDRFTYWVRRAAAGGEMLAPGPPDAPLQFVDVRDLAAFMLELAEQRAAGPFHVVGPGEPCTFASLLEACTKVAGSDVNVRWGDEPFLREHVPTGAEEAFPLWVGDLPGYHAFDPSRAVAAGLRYRPVEETVRATLEWDRSRPQDRPMAAGLDPAMERAMLAALAGGP
jgi:nucleoside-diphosphate-sugar epimerase